MKYIYKCNNCNNIFKEPDETNVWLEDMYGVTGEFPTRTIQATCCCPYCNSLDIEECSVDELILGIVHRQIEESNIDIYDWLETNWEE